MDTESRSSHRRPEPAGAVCAALVTAVLTIAALPVTASAQEAPAERNCFRSWTVSFMEESEPFTVDRAPWVLRWRRITPTHTEHDGLFAELYRVEEGEKTEDQVAAVNTDHEGHEGTVTVEETGTFWLDMESWSEKTEWRIRACHPAEPPPEGGAR